MKETQTALLLERVKILLELIQTPLANKVLEIDNNAESLKKKELLHRLYRSLDQYVSKKQELTYIGFLGHYSSGKSSSINSILSLNESSHKRETGLNPTDTAITLITAERNANALILMTRETNHVPVRTTFIDHDLLLDTVIADTPGSGDPQVINEIVQDFLPICDYIIYFISATNPLDQADLPLLHQKTTKLPFIPTTFVITRADEFRAARTSQLNETNIDHIKRTLFLGTLITRIKDILKIGSFSFDDFTFIDNEASYGIADLQKKISEWSRSKNAITSSQIHNYKIDYFSSNLDSIYTHFIKLIDDKIQKGDDFLKTAFDNITRFDKSIAINNEKLRLGWIKESAILDRQYQSEIGFLGELKSRELFIESYTDSLARERRALLDYIEHMSNGHLGRLTQETSHLFKQRIKEVKHAFIRDIENTETVIENLSSFIPARISIPEMQRSLEIDLTRLEDHLDVYQKAATQFLLAGKASVNKKLVLLNNSLQHPEIIPEIEVIYSEGSETISKDFDVYFEMIHMYRSSVLSMNTKRAIEQLRIGNELDRLDAEFEDEFILKVKNRAVLEVYFDNKTLTEQYLSNISNLQTSVERTRSKIEDFQLEIIKSPEKLDIEQIDLHSFSSEILANIDSTVNFQYQEKIKEMNDIHDRNLEKYHSDEKNIRKKRKKRLVKWSILAGIVFLLAYAALRFSAILKPSTVSITTDTLFALLSTAIGNFIGYIFSSAKLDIKSLSMRNKEMFIKQQRSALIQSANESFWDNLILSATDKKESTNADSLRLKLYQNVNPYMTAINDSTKDNQKRLQALNQEISGLINEYMTTMTDFYKAHSSIFSNPDENIKRIESITREIKEVAIKPSFELLKDTAEGLHTVKASIKRIYTQ